MDNRKYWLLSPFSYVQTGIILLLVLLILLLSGNLTLKIISLLAGGAAIGVSLLYSRTVRENIHTYISRLSDSLNIGNRDALNRIPVPAVSVSAQGEIVWYNEQFREIILLGADAQGVMLPRVFKGFDQSWLEKDNRFEVKKEKKVYTVTVGAHEVEQTTQYVLYFNDITDLKRTENQFLLSRPAVMLIVFDNEEELLKVRENERVRVISAVESLLGKWVADYNCISRINARDRSFIMVEQQYLEKIISSRFSILTEARKIVIEGGNPVTLSIGVGYGGANFSECEYWANQALEMALGRGGDQASVKDTDGYSFYGGVSKSVEKQSKVRTRMVAQAMVELINAADKCFIMGHRFSDLDAIGAGIGLASLISALQKDTGHTVSIVVDESATLALPLINAYRETREVNWFIPPDEALDTMTDDSLLIVVDTHSPEVIESKAVYNAAQTVVTIDHHRLSVKRIQNSVIFFHEPYASSTCEMVTELAPYMHETAIARPEAEALLSGIMLDTKSFVLKTGARTFEAAAYLRRRGADTIEVKRFFSGSLQTYIEKSQLVSSARLYGDCAISCAAEEVEGVRVIASQAADELLNINGVVASFVLYVSGAQINISARSLGRFNVQLVMEKLGGGGHMTMAAAQLSNVTMDEAEAKLKAAIDEFRDDQAQEQRESVK
ncbi:MAG: DHH family phosphoesterase [Clostridia bacterium]|nr:DHH family phosphoesterase [Clostridia bacterium]MBQ4397029.1 DHH family phosphoesterase [Clostridia bacterium]